MLLTNRRTVVGVMKPPMWRVDQPSCNLYAYKTAVIDKTETVTFHSNSPQSCMQIGGVIYNPGTSVTLAEGEYTVKVYVHKRDGFPAAYCEGDVFATDETWLCCAFDGNDKPVGTNDMYTELSDDPEVFKFSYERIYPCSVEKAAGGRLYDFGKECFGNIILEDVQLPNSEIPVFCGESREEALDPPNAIVQFKAKVENGYFKSSPVAFRYIFIPLSSIELKLSADFEYIPLEDKGAFRCSDETVNKIWDTASYTLHLNAREGFFDGIKRDRWIWSGDAYQSYFVNYYLMNDNDIVRRTTLMLKGSEPMTHHINTISDYTFYWIIGIWEYYFYTGDRDFVIKIYDKMCSAMNFIMGRLDENGLYAARKGDWVFIDWANFDKDSGPMCAEQILLFKTYESMAKCAELIGDACASEKYSSLAEKICGFINELYWDEEKGAYVDDYKTGNRNVTRHANIFAILYGVADETKKARIINDVIKNKEIAPITTPYFEFFELDAMCRIGEYKYMTDMLKSYWGGMLELGATSFWEEFDPNDTGLEHYKMYSSKFGKSLCHAWSSSPIYLLGRYALGVYPTSAGYKTFEIKPNIMDYEFIKGTVPTPSGNVEVEMTKDFVKVVSEIDGGTLIIDGKTYNVEKGTALSVNR